MNREANFQQASGLTEGALSAGLDVAGCGLPYWIEAVAQGTWSGLVNGHLAQANVPEHMFAVGPLREALLEEFAFRSVGEELATRALCYLVIHAPDRACMEFYLTQALDEARHSSVFRGHLLELGIAESDMEKVIARHAGEQIEAILKPLEAWVLQVVRDRKDFIGGVVLFTILIEGLLAPAAEISERKWRLIDPPAAQIEWGANVDEIRHLSVGASILKRHLRRNPTEKARLLGLVEDGRRVWASLPADAVVLRRERLFQAGMQDVRHLLRGYELAEGQPLLDTTPESRLALVNEMTRRLQNGRLLAIGLEEALA